MDFIKKHPKLAITLSVTGFIFTQLPQAILAWQQLLFPPQQQGGISLVSAFFLAIPWYFWLSSLGSLILLCILIAVIVSSARKPTSTNITEQPLQKKEAADPLKPKVQYVVHKEYRKQENISLKQQAAEMQKQIDNANKTKSEDIVNNKPTEKAPSRLMHDNVLWEDEGDYWGGGGIIVNGPLCPKDYAILMTEHYDKIEELKYDKLISPDDFHYRLYCPECKNKYVLGENPKETNSSLTEVRNRFAGLRKRKQIT